MKTIEITNKDGTVEKLYQWSDCLDKDCNPGKHPMCWKCEICNKVHFSSVQAQKCQLG